MSRKSLRLLLDGDGYQLKQAGVGRNLAAQGYFYAHVDLVCSTLELPLH